MRVAFRTTCSRTRPPRRRPTVAEKPAKRPAQKPQRTKVLVTVVDGDTHKRLQGARVVIGKRADYANTRGLAAVRIKHSTALEVRISKPGYATRTVRMPFKQRREVTARLYRKALQWTMFGAQRPADEHPGRDLDQAAVQGRLVARARLADRVSRGRLRGRRLHRELQGDDLRRLDAERQGRLDATTRPAGRWPPRRRSSDANVVVHGMDGVVRVLDRRNGRLRWSYRVGSPIESSPVIANGIDYFGAWNGRIYALDLKRRKLRWRQSMGAKITSSAALAGKTLYIGDYAGRLIAISTTSGKVRFTSRVNGRIYGTPAVSGGRVFVPSSTGGSLTAFTTGGRYLWRVSTGSYVYSSPAVWAGRVFFGSYNGRFYSVAASSGRVLWSVAAGGPVSGAAVVVAGVAYAGSTYGRITGVRAKTGRVVLRFPHGEYVPVSGNGKRLLLHGYSRIWAVEER